MKRTIKQSGFFTKIAMAMLDAVLLIATGYFAFFIRFEFSFSAIPSRHLDTWIHFLPIQIAVTIVVFFLFKLYSFIWSSVSVRDLCLVICGTLASNAICFCIQYFTPGIWLPRSVVFLWCMLQLCAYAATRFAYRVWQSLSRRKVISKSGNICNVMIIGAGAAGRVLIREYMNSTQMQDTKVCCIIDDDRSKWNKYVEGIKIVGGREDIPHYAKSESIDQIIFAIPTADAKNQKEILDICSSTGCKLKTIPGIYQMVNDDVSTSMIRDVKVEDLLGRDPIVLDTGKMAEFIGGKTVMVTGGGGSIGSELCRQIARFDPFRLVILDIYENNAYEIQQELIRTYGTKLQLNVEIASVRDKDKIYRIFDLYKPEVVFHAAAHKHVPLMESCPEEAIKNNIFGTWHVMRASEKCGAMKFVMISTDKAVNPTNVMGATKRFCEMMVMSRTHSATEFCAVRFGNVLGSNGSVVPLFKKQIENGGPVTITDKRIIRYFMTIPEAAQLVLEAGSMARSNQIFVLDMGEPVKILDLAENLIRLSGRVPYKDIKIVEIGLRPGEKLYEELLMSATNLVSTPNKKIFVEQQEYIDSRVIMQQLQAFDSALCAHYTDYELTKMIKSFVPTFKDPVTYNSIVR